MKIVYSVCLFLLICPCLSAEDAKLPLISVTGTHEINVEPDEIIITVNIDNREKQLKTAKSKTDEQAQKVIGLAQSNGVQAKDVVTSHIAVKPVYSYKKEGRNILYFQAGQRIIVTVRDFSKYDSLMDSLITAGLNRTFVEYDISDMPGYRQKARINAILAARDKAQSLAEAIGQKIGKAYSIKEIAQSDSIYQPNLLSNSISLSTSRSGEDDSDISPLSIGNIKVKVSVEVSFLLE